jgi:hypothetical protein
LVAEGLRHAEATLEDADRHAPEGRPASHRG